MNAIKYIFTNRMFSREAYYDIVYEWEDILSDELKLKKVGLSADWSLSGLMRLMRYFKNCIISKELRNKGGVLLTPKQTGIQFYMSVPFVKTRQSKNVIPWIIDFYLSKDELSQFNEVYRKYPIVLISSKEAYEFIRSNLDVVRDVNFVHCALSISDKYKLSDQIGYEKEYDIALMGRQNPVLEKFFYMYAQSHPSLKYVYRKQQGNQFLYICHQNGEENIIDDVNTRDKYINLMRSVRIGLYATPGIDRNVHGYNQVTPRFLELIACKAHVIARYPNNPDTEYYEMQRIAPSVNTYEEFEQAMDYALTHPVDEALYKEYLQKHYTSVRAKELKEMFSID